ncbi:MAG: KH domain-containing protein [Epsilonproteobacteria bacterium]|nr:KH domain-containing protein [Campylobacterota bacterium]NPA56464.1 KH domain-containing protein [Campylobacterota bacterium]
MVQEFVERFAKLLANYPDDIDVEYRQVNPNYAEITIYANRADAGKIIGKEGKMIGAIKTVISGCKAKNGISYKVSVTPKDS